MKSHAYRPLLLQEAQQDFVARQIESGATIQEALGIPSGKMVEFYEFAQELYNEKRYQDAADVLLSLSVMNPYVYEVWLARGIAEYQIHNIQNSLYAFHMAISLAPTQSEPYLKLIFILEEMNEHQTADDVITLIQQIISKENPEDPGLKIAEQMRERIKKEQKDGA